eukprot:768082-Hanusia_phi.AAC.1
MKKSLEILRIRLGKRALNFEHTHGRPCGIADIRADKAWVIHSAASRLVTEADRRGSERTRRRWK